MMRKFGIVSAGVLAVLVTAFPMSSADACGGCGSRCGGGCGWGGWGSRCGGGCGSSCGSSCFSGCNSGCGNSCSSGYSTCGTTYYYGSPYAAGYTVQPVASTARTTTTTPV